MENKAAFQILISRIREGFNTDNQAAFQIPISRITRRF